MQVGLGQHVEFAHTRLGVGQTQGKGGLIGDDSHDLLGGCVECGYFRGTHRGQYPDHRAARAQRQDQRGPEIRDGVTERVVGQFLHRDGSTGAEDFTGM